MIESSLLFPSVPDIPQDALSSLHENPVLQQLLAVQIQSTVVDALDLIGKRQFDEAYGLYQSLLRLLDLKGSIKEAHEFKFEKPKKDPYSLNP